MKKIIGKVKEKIADCVEIKLRKICLGMNRDTRIIVAATIIVVSAFGSVFILATAVYQVGKYRGRQEIQIEHIKAPELLMKTNQKNSLETEKYEEE